MDSESSPAGSGRRTWIDGELEMPAQPVPVVTGPEPTLLSGGITAAPRAHLPTAVREPNGRFRRGAPSPNPSGRARVAPEVKEAARSHTADMLAVLVEVALDGAAPPAARVAAANAVLDRGHGKPVASLEAKVATVDFSAMHLDALRKMSRPSP